MVEAAFALSALGCIFATVGWPVAIVQDATGRSLAETEQRWQRPIADIFMHWAALAEFLVGHLDATPPFYSREEFTARR